MQATQEIGEVHVTQDMSYKIDFPSMTHLKLTQST